MSIDWQGGGKMLKTFYIALCDDQEYYRKQLYNYLLEYQKDKNIIIHINEYSSGGELLQASFSQEGSYQIYFLDVNMPDMQGTTVAKELRNIGKNSVICFVTSFKEYAYDAFQVEAMDYIVKPINYEQLKKFMDKAIVLCRLHIEVQEAEKKYLSIQQRQTTIILEQRHILYIEKRRNQCVVCTNTEEILCYNTLKNLYEQLNSSIFMFTHQGYIVNFYHIKEIRSNMIYMGNNILIPVSRKYQEAIKKRFEEKLERLRQNSLR